MKITVRKDRVYGKIRYYPVGPEAERILEGISHGDRKTFSAKEIEFVRTMGVEVVAETPKI